MPMKAAAKAMVVSSTWERERRTLQPMLARAMIRIIRVIPARWFPAVARRTPGDREGVAAAGTAKAHVGPDSFGGDSLEGLSAK